jgi:hypothetical protein
MLPLKYVTCQRNTKSDVKLCRGALCKGSLVHVNDFGLRNGGKNRREICKRCHSYNETQRYHSVQDKLKEKENGRIRNWRHFGLTPVGYDKLITLQNNVCAICGSSYTGSKNTKYFSVDHNHKTGNIRGLLCRHCNTGLGCFKDNPDFLTMAAAYLTQE